MGEVFNLLTLFILLLSSTYSFGFFMLISPLPLSEDVTEQPLNQTVSVSAGRTRRKLLEIHTDRKPWHDALNDCRNRGYQTLVYTPPNGAILKIVRRNLQEREGISQIEVWTGYLYYNYDWMDNPVCVRERNCAEIDANEFGINTTSTSYGPYCITAMLDDNVPDIVMATKPCTESYAYVCYWLDDVVLTMDVKTNIHFDWFDYKVLSEPGQDDMDCQRLCLDRRFCVVTSYIGEGTCRYIYYNMEVSLVMTYTQGNQTVAFKDGDSVFIANDDDMESTTPATSMTYFSEFPCEPKQKFTSYIQPTSTRHLTSMSGSSNDLSSPSTDVNASPRVVFATSQILFSFFIQSAEITPSSILKMSSTSDLPTDLNSETISLYASETFIKVISSSSSDSESYVYYSEMLMTSSDITMTQVSHAQSTISLIDTFRSVLSTTSVMNVDSASYSNSNYETFSSSQAVQTSVNSCKCPCHKAGSSNNISSSYHLDISKIAVTKTNLSSYKRKFVSVTDTRTSSKTIGCFGAIILILCVAFLIFLDSPRLISQSSIFKKKKGNISC